MNYSAWILLVSAMSYFQTKNHIVWQTFLAKTSLNYHNVNRSVSIELEISQRNKEIHIYRIVWDIHIYIYICLFCVQILRFFQQLTGHDFGTIFIWKRKKPFELYMNQCFKIVLFYILITVFVVFIYLSFKKANSGRGNSISEQ